MALTKDYEAFYADGGWRYDYNRERDFLKDRIIAPLELRTGMRLMDLGCGMGLFSSLFHELGFDVTGVDRSQTGIANANAKFPGPEFICTDASEIMERFEPESFDILYIRGMSWYHYEQTTVNKHGVDVPERTRDFFRLLVPGGIFILQIKTDFTGSRPPAGVHHNAVDDYVGLFDPLGEIVLLTDWDGTPLKTNKDGEMSGKNVIIATRRVPGGA